MIQDREKQLLNIIKYTPMMIIIVIATLFTLFLYFENKKTFNSQKAEIEKNYVIDNKIKIKTEIEKLEKLILHKQKNTINKLKENIKQRVYESHSIATGIYNTYKDTKTKKEILELIKTSLGEVRFNNGRGYIFMDDAHGNKILHSVDKSIENKNFYNYTDPKGYYFFRTIVQTIKDKTERFDEYYWYKPNTNNKKIAKKISFYKYFEPLNMAIGTGEYIEDFEKTVQKEILETIEISSTNPSSYIFVLSYDGKYLSHIKKEYINKNAFYSNDTTDSKNDVSSVITIAKNGGGYYSYIQNKKPNTTVSSKKVSYVKSIDTWQWVIGTGFYEDDVLGKILNKKKEIDDKFNEYINDFLIIIVVLTFILLIASIYVSKVLKELFFNYKEQLHKKQNMLFQQSKMAAMGEMIGNIAHQWRQPLSTITTASTGMKLQKELNGELDTELFNNSVDKINASAQHLSKTIDDFRNFFSPNKKESKFYLKDIFATTLDLVSAQFNAKEIKIIKHIDNVELFTYENELIQALINILNNARDELIKLPRGKDRLIFIDTSLNDNNGTTIEIKDSAGGIDNSIMNKIFEPYFTTKHKSNGTGIGLYMTKEIIVKHLQGELEVENCVYEYNGNICNGALFRIKIKNIEDK